jgi:alginate O-acetyltransferase complex protein AlgI
LPPRLIVGWLLVIGGGVACVLVRDRMDMNPWVGLSVLVLLVTSKAATLLRLDAGDRRRLSRGRLLAYLCWPGLRPAPFLKGAPPARPQPLWRNGLVSLASGAVLLWVVPLWLPPATPWPARLTIAAAGFALVTGFGLMDWWAALYRGLAFPVEKLWDNPAAATSLADFWGNRWNRIFSGFARDLIFLPLARAAGVRVASFGVFLFSGLLHDWAWSGAVRGGYGGPTLYFLLQGLFTQVESTALGRRLIRQRPAVGRAWTWLMVLVPLPLALHPPYLTGYAVPFLRDLGVKGL